MTVTPDVVLRTAAALRAALAPLAVAHWDVTVPGSEWTCWETGVHLADSYVAQAAQVAMRPADGWVPLEATVPHTAGVPGLVDAIDAGARMLVATVASADPASRAWHPWGAADPEGWLAMGVVEGLVHTFDITTALDEAWTPPADLAAPAVARLFPDAPGGDPAEVLLWCTGRAALPGRDRQQTWRWWSSPR